MSFNHAEGNAKVGMQVDGDVVITGGLNVSMPAGGHHRADGDDRTRDPEEGTGNTARGSDVVAVQAQNIRRGNR